MVYLNCAFEGLLCSWTEKCNVGGRLIYYGYSFNILLNPLYATQKMVFAHEVNVNIISHERTVLALAPAPGDSGAGSE